MRQNPHLGAPRRKMSGFVVRTDTGTRSNEIGKEWAGRVPALDKKQGRTVNPTNGTR